MRIRTLYKHRFHITRNRDFRAGKVTMKKYNPLTSEQIRAFRNKIYHYFKKNQRDLPWRHTSNPYHIFISEVMLQQTQVDRVIPKYNHFIETYPDFNALASVSVYELLKSWQGLGYNRRALMLQKASQIIVTSYNGILPESESELEKLPGIGPNTAASICVFAFNKPVIFIETNIRTVFIHEFFTHHDNVIDIQLIPLIECTLDRKKPLRWYSALMDYGSYLKKTNSNPGRKSKYHAKQSPFQGSNRQIRGKIIRLLLEEQQLTQSQIVAIISSSVSPDNVISLLKKLVAEGFLKKKGKYYSISS